MLRNYTMAIGYGKPDPNGQYGTAAQRAFLPEFVNRWCACNGLDALIPFHGPSYAGIIARLQETESR